MCNFVLIACVVGVLSLGDRVYRLGRLIKVELHLCDCKEAIIHTWGRPSSATALGPLILPQATSCPCSVSPKTSVFPVLSFGRILLTIVCWDHVGREESSCTPPREGILSIVGKIIVRSDDIFIPYSLALLLIGTGRTVACVPTTAQSLYHAHLGWKLHGV